MNKFNDEYDGIGGSYQFNPETGKRTPIVEERAEPIQESLDQPAEDKSDGLKK